MRRLLCLAVFAAAACTKPAHSAKEVTVAEASALAKAGTATFCDANDDEYRAAAGHVPGAVLLTSFNEYAPAELPEDKARALVFYCTGRL